MAGWGTVHQGIPPDNRLWLGDICLSSVCVTVNHLGWSEAGSQRAGKGLQRDRIVMLDLQCEGVAGAMRGTHCNVIWVDVSLLSPRSRSQGSGRSSDHEFLRRCPRGVGGGWLDLPGRLGICSTSFKTVSGPHVKTVVSWLRISGKPSSRLPCYALAVHRVDLWIWEKGPQPSLVKCQAPCIRFGPMREWGELRRLLCSRRGLDH